MITYNKQNGTKNNLTFAFPIAFFGTDTLLNGDKGCLTNDRTYGKINKINITCCINTG